MKKFSLTISMTLFIVLTTIAQSPQAFKYQAVVRDNAGEIIANQSVKFRISILESSAGGTVIYRETHTKLTNAFGVVNIEIGNGSPNIGSFSGIDWGSGSKYLKTEIDPSGGSSYVTMGTAQLMSVPYALFSENTANTDDADADPANEIQTLSISGNDLSISDGNTISLPGTGGGDNLGNHTATQNIKLNGKWLSNDGGNEGVFVSTGGAVGIGTNTPSNKLVVDGIIQAESGLRVDNAWENGVLVLKAGNPSTSYFNNQNNGFNVSGAEAHGLNVSRADACGVKIFEAGADGIHITKAGTPSTTHTTAFDYESGIEIEGADDYGIFVGYAGRDGVFIEEANYDGFTVKTAGNASTSFSSSSNNGFEVKGAQGYGLYVGRADADGIYIKSSGDDGVSIDQAADDGFYVHKAGNPSTTVSDARNNGLEIAGAEDYGVYIGQSDDDGIRIYKTGNPSTTHSSSEHNGVEIAGVSGSGLYVGQADEYGVQIYDANKHGVNIGYTGYDGVYIYNAGNPTTASSSIYENNGIEVAGAENHGLYVGRADDDGVYIDDAGRYGLNVNIANEDGVHIKKAGSPSSTSSSSYDNGVEIEGAGRNGVWIGHTNYHGLVVNHADGSGVYVSDADGDGVYISNADDDGVYVSSADDRALYGNTTKTSKEWGLYTPDKVYANNVTSKGNSSYAKNSGGSTLEPGDVVCIAGGLEENLLDGYGFPVVKISKATKSNSQAVFGVVEYKVSIQEKEKKSEDGELSETRKSFEYADGNVSPGEYLSVIVFGQAEVKVNSSEDVKAGDALVAGEGKARKVKTTEVNGITIAENTGIIGKALENTNGKGKVMVFVNCR